MLQRISKVMKWFKKILKSEVRSAGRRGFSAPFILVLVGVASLLFVPINDESLDFKSGIIEKCNNDYSKFWLINQKRPYEIGLKRYRDKLLESSPRGKRVDVWTKRNKRNVLQLRINNEMIIEYKWKNQIKVPLFFIFVGSILIPFVIREKKGMDNSEKSLF